MLRRTRPKSGRIVRSIPPVRCLYGRRAGQIWGRWQQSGLIGHGRHQVLGLRVAENEEAKFWLQVAADLKNRGVKDVFVACVDGTEGFQEAVEAVFLRTQIQLCPGPHGVPSLRHVSWKQRKEVADGPMLKTFCQTTLQRDLAACEAKWDGSYPLHQPVLATKLGDNHPVFRLS